MTTYYGDKDKDKFWFEARKMIILCALGFIIFYTIMSWVLIGVYYDEMDYLNNGKEVTAVYDSYYEILSSSSPIFIEGYQLQYKYYLENGEERSGWGPKFVSKTEAQSYIGKEVIILVNDKGNSMIKGDRTTTSLEAIYIQGGVMTGVSLTAISLVIIFRKKIFKFVPKELRKKKGKKNKSEENA